MVKRRAFTLIELLVAIAIIGLLVGIATIAMGRIMDSQNRNRTKVHLQAAAGVLAEYDAQTGLRRQPPYMWKGGTTPVKHDPAVDGAFNIWQDADPDTADMQAVPLLGSVDKDEPGGAWASAPVRNAGLVVGVAGKSSATATKILGQLPADAMVTVTGEPLPVPTDAWGNPLIFVPAAGLTVNLADTTTAQIVTSTRTYVQGGKTGELAAGTIAPGARPFFASAGPDGNFTKGDDNVYSFE